MSRAPTYCTRWKHRAIIYNSTNNTHTHDTHDTRHTHARQRPTRNELNNYALETKLRTEQLSQHCPLVTVKYPLQPVPLIRFIIGSMDSLLLPSPVSPSCLNQWSFPGSTDSGRLSVLRGTAKTISLVMRGRIRFCYSLSACSIFRFVPGVI